ncbi:hypothetical protein U3516DRAFT_738522 [Neocallimastix sp. 'constans']
MKSDLDLEISACSVNNHNKYFCIKNNVDRRLGGNTLNFQTSKSEYSEWYNERWNQKWVDSINEVVEKNLKLKLEPKIIPKSTTTMDILIFTDQPTSDCYSKTGYPYCSLENIDIAYTHETGSWGFENDL